MTYRGGAPPPTTTEEPEMTNTAAAQTATTTADLTVPQLRMLAAFALAGSDEKVAIKPQQEKTRAKLEDLDTITWSARQSRWVPSNTGWDVLRGWDEWAAMAQAKADHEAELAAQAEANPVDDEIAAVMKNAPAKVTAAATSVTAKPTKGKKPEPTACLCSKFEAVIMRDGDNAGDEPEIVSERSTGCDALTARSFAPGHDAKLVAFLVAAELDGYELSLNDGMSISGDAVGLLKDQVGSSLLAGKARRAIEAGQRKAAAKAKREAEKAQKTATAKPENKADTAAKVAK